MASDPELSIDEVKVALITCPFWIQNMTTINAIRIGKSLGTLLDVENETYPGVICTHHIRIRVEIDTTRSTVFGSWVSNSSPRPLFHLGSLSL